MADVFIYRVSVPEKLDSYVEWTECEGFGSPKHLIYNKNRSIDFAAIENTVSASSAATIQIVGTCYPYPSCLCSYTPLPSTTTTTLAPVNFTIATDCTGIGINGTGRITINTFTGGTGTYYSVGIGTTSGQAFNATQIELLGATSYQFTNLSNGTYFVILRDDAGNYKINNIVVSCTNTTTTTSTTSTTTAALNCNFNGGSAVITYTTTTTTSTTAAPTTTTTAAPTSTTTTTSTTIAPTTTTTTSAPSNTINVYGKDIAGGTVYIDYYINSVGPYSLTNPINSGTCTSIDSILGFNSGDNIEFVTGYYMKGSTTGCPSVPNQINYYYTAVSGVQTVYLTTDSSNGL